MKTLKLFLAFLLSVVFVVACGSDPDPSPKPDSNSKPVTYRQSVTLTAKGDAQIMTLNDLNSSISSVNNTANWLTVVPQYYTSGHPQIELNASENTSESERKTEVVILASSGTKVILSVTQMAGSSEDIHDVKTDNPAYSPINR